MLLRPAAGMALRFLRPLKSVPQSEDPHWEEPWRRNPYAPKPRDHRARGRRGGLSRRRHGSVGRRSGCLHGAPQGAAGRHRNGFRADPAHGPNHRNWCTPRGAGQALSTQPQYAIPAALALNFPVFRNLSFSPAYTVFRYASQVTGQSLVDNSYSVLAEVVFCPRCGCSAQETTLLPGPRVWGPDSVD